MEYPPVVLKMDEFEAPVSHLVACYDNIQPPQRTFNAPAAETRYHSHYVVFFFFFFIFENCCRGVFQEEGLPGNKCESFKRSAGHLMMMVHYSSNPYLTNTQSKITAIRGSRTGSLDYEDAV